jgi:hypothetical protein
MPFDMNAALREAAGRNLYRIDQAADINRALRDAAVGEQLPDGAGAGVEPDDQVLAAARRLLDVEPFPWEDAWRRWARSHEVMALLDQNGRLPGERYYRPDLTRRAMGQAAYRWDQAHEARRQRMSRRYGD